MQLLVWCGALELGASWCRCLAVKLQAFAALLSRMHEAVLEWF